ncbi:hypothetical protein ES703_93377 [subsurface metagenome]
MALGFNERKAQVLTLLAREGDWVSCREVAQAFGISQSNAGNLLRGYSGDGLTRRRRVQVEGLPPYYVFRIGENGRKKLIWLLGRSMAQAPLPGFPEELVGRPRVLKPRLVKPRVVKRVVRPRILREESD